MCMCACVEKAQGESRGQSVCVCAYVLLLLLLLKPHAVACNAPAPPNTHIHTHTQTHTHTHTHKHTHTHTHTHTPARLHTGCTDKVPSCGATCGKLLPCGVHTCADRCHQGECSAQCRGPAVKSCRCGKSQKEVLCFQVGDWMCFGGELHS